MKLLETEEITRVEIAELLGCTPQRVGQLTFLPKPLRSRQFKEWQGDQNHYYDKAAVLAALREHRPDYDKKVSTMDECKQQIDNNLVLKFITGKFDPKEKQKEYEALRYWSATRKPKTTRVRVKDPCSMKGKDPDELNRSPRRPRQSMHSTLQNHPA